MKQYFFSFCILSATASLAQITVTSADMPNANDSVKVSDAASTAGVDHTLSGSNYAWDFSALTPTAQRYEKFDAPSTFPSPYNFIFSTFTTTYGLRNYQNVGAPVPGFAIEADYDFFRKSTANLRQNGIGYTLNGATIPMIYSKPDTIYDFPMNYGDTMACDYKFSTPTIAAVPFYYGETGHRQSVVDGWGTLTTPFGTFPALRIRSVITATDSIYLDTLGFGQAFAVPTRIEYKWFGAGSKTPLLQVDAVEGGGGETVNRVVYQDSIRAEVPQVGIAEIANASSFSVYPNPASEYAVVNYELRAASKVKISMSTLTGQVVAVIANETVPAGRQVVTIDLAALNLKPGMYFLSLENGNSREVKRMVITR
ncbi:MAG: hypothetical protein JWO09_1988 [Bacteroidetes bacterium]|nr:hypothetical protein [Bacteroidota bacterium]